LKTLDYFELDLPRCANTYGVAPCTAALTGDNKCFNSRASCQDLPNFRVGYPLVESVTQTEFNSDTTAHAVSMPATVNVGDLLLTLFANDGTSTVTTPAGWTALGTVTSADYRGSVYGKVAAGTEDGTTVDFVTAAIQTAAAQVFRVLKNNWQGSLQLGVSVTLGTTVTSAVPDPPESAPAWGDLPTLWIAGFFASSVATVDEYPGGFSEGLNSQGGTTTTGASVSTAYLNAKAESYNPGPFDLAASAVGAAFTIAVKCFESVQMRFSRPTDYLPRDIDALPNIESIDHTPAVIGLGDTLGERATLSITFKDHPHSDTPVSVYDKYLSERTYVPFNRGTHFGKFRSRHPYLQGSACRLYRGFEGDSLDAMEKRQFFVESTDGPTINGKFSILAKDVLKFLDGDRAQAPAANSGVLQDPENSASGGYALLPAGIGDEEYPTGGFYVSVGGSEVVSVTRSSGSDNLTVVQTGEKNTEAIDHDVGERVQVVLWYDAQDVADIIYDLLLNYAGVPGAYLPLADWRTETGTFLNQLYTAYITEPTSVKMLVSELIEQAGLALWWSDLDETVHLQVLRAVASSADAIDPDAYLKGSLSIQEQPEKRASQVWTFYGQRNPTRPLDEESNFAYSSLTIDTEAEAAYSSSAIKKIYSRWIPGGGSAIAERLNDIQLSRYRIPPRKFNFDLFRSGPADLQLGEGCRLSAWPLQDFTGDADTIPAQVVSVKSEADRTTITAEELEISVAVGLNDDVIVIGSNTNNVNLEELHDQLYPVAESGDNVICYIQSNARVGSDDSSEPALRVGSFVAGVNLYLVVAGRIQGCGGEGGDGGAGGDGARNSEGAESGSGGQDGADGGTALYTRRAINVDASGGEIWGGGGGGGGGGAGTNAGQGGGRGSQGQGGSGSEGGSADDGEDASGGGSGSSGSSSGNSGGDFGDGGNGGNGGNVAGTGQEGGDGGNGGDGDNGGGPGQSGSTGSSGQSGQDGNQSDGKSGGSGGSGGSAGAATNGDSFVSYGVWDGSAFTPGATGTEDIRGSEIN
jgi:hypothetical protein